MLKSICIDNFNVFVGVPVIEDSGAVVVLTSAPLPSTNARQRTVVPGPAGSARPLPIGIVLSLPLVVDEHLLTPPATSANVMIIEGRPLGNAPGALNNP